MMAGLRRTLIVSTTLLVALVALAATAGVARAARPTQAPLSTSSNWAGYAVAAAGQSFGDVKGSWTVPTVSCPARSSSYSSFWVGIGGYATSSNGLEQTGTSSDCQNGTPTYYAWYELIPAPSVNVQLTVSPGDQVSAEVSISGTAVTLALTDVTTGQTFSKTQTTSSPDVSSAEWIAEAPSQCSGLRVSSCQTLPLANFGTAGFTAASATANAHTGTISDPAWTAVGIQLEPTTRGSLSATPSALSADGSSFTVATAAATPAPTPPTRVAPSAGGHGFAPGWSRWRWPGRHR
jgi:hypothetical protein